MFKKLKQKIELEERLGYEQSKFDVEQSEQNSSGNSNIENCKRDDNQDQQPNDYESQSNSNSSINQIDNLNSHVENIKAKYDECESQNKRLTSENDKLKLQVDEFQNEVNKIVNYYCNSNIIVIQILYFYRSSG